VDTSDPGNIAAAIRPETRAIFVETPSNPILKITDLAAVSAIGVAQSETDSGRTGIAAAFFAIVAAWSGKRAAQTCIIAAFFATAAALTCA
jgi:hypothetical protein